MRSGTDVRVSGSVMIHPTAIVDKKAKIAEGVEVGPYSIIGPDVAIGAGTKIGPHCVIEAYTVIGKNCGVHTGAVIGGVTQDLKFRGDRSFVEIGDNNSIREYVTINRSTTKDAATRIGNDNLIMAYTHIAHDCRIGNNVIIANAGTFAGHVIIEDNATIGGMVGIHQFVNVGAFAIIGGCSKVVKHIPPYAMADGHPAKIYGLNVVGLKRAGISAETRNDLKHAFKILFGSGLSLPHALKKADGAPSQSKEVKYLINFLKTVKTNTKRGVCR